MAQDKKIKFQHGSISFDVIIKDNRAWLSTKEMAILFNVSQRTINRYLSTYKNADESTTLLKTAGDNDDFLKNNSIRMDSNNRSVIFYSLEVVIELGTRLRSENGLMLKSFVEKELHYFNNSFNNTVVTYSNGALNIDVTVSPEEETIWLTQNQIAELFDTTRPNISMHIKNIISEGELEISSICKNFLRMGSNSQTYQVTLFNLDLVLAVGYRVKSSRAIQFRKWVTNILREYLINGYSFNDNRLASCNESIVRLQNEIAKIKENLSDLENSLKDKDEALFLDGQYYDAFEYVTDIFKKADKSVVIIDPFFDINSLKYLRFIKKNIIKKIYLSDKNLIDKDVFESFKKQYGPINLYLIKKFHDRFVIIDNKDCYAIGTSLNHLGNKTFAVYKIKSESIINLIHNKMNKSQNLM